MLEPEEDSTVQRDRVTAGAATTRRDAFVGRQDVLCVLQAALADALNGRGRVVLLTGEPGIGKTRTASEFAEQARGAGACVLWGVCYDGEWAPPFGPFAEAIAAYARQAESDTLRDALGFGASSIARVIPAVRERLPDVPEPSSLQPDEERFRLLDAVSQFLIAVAGRTPLILVLDDLHWADKGSIAMLRHVARFAPQHRVLLLGTYRDAELDALHPLTDALGALYRETTCERILLKGLDAADVAQLIADSQVPAERRDTVADAINAVTNGNPFFVREVLHYLVEERQLAGAWTDGSRTTVDRIIIPDSVRQVLNRRVRRLGGETGRLLSAAAAFGGSFDLNVAAHVARLDEAVALNAIDAALRAQLVRPAETAERYAFTHALIRETLYSEPSPSRRVRLHRQIAEAMEHRYGDLVGEHAVAVAQQYHRSKDLPGAERGVTYAVAAADRAEAMYAHDEVARLLRIAVELTPQTAPRPARLLGRLALALTWALNFDEAVQVAHEAGELIAATEGAAAAADYLGEATINLGGAGSLQWAFNVARAGMAYIGARRDLTWLRLASYDVMRREQADAEYPGIPLDCPERQEMSVLVRSLSSDDLKGIMFIMPLASRHEVQRPPRDPIHLPQVQLHSTGDFRTNVEVLEESATRCEREGRINSAAIYLAGVARCRLALGEIAAADEAYAHAIAFRDRLPVSSAALGAATYRFERCKVVNEGWADLFSTRGEFAGQRDAAHLYSSASIQAGAAVVRARLGRAEAALRRLATLPAALDRAPAWAPNYTQIACNAADTLWSLERTDYADCVERNLRDKVIEPDFRYPMGDSRLALAQLCALQRRYDEAVEWFARARVVLDEQGARPLRAIVDYDEALMYVRRGEAGDVKRAASLLEAALRQFHAVGMPGWITSAEALQKTLRETRDRLFVGRARELESLRTALEATRDGHGRLVLLVGEPGIGKTRTAAEFVEQARRAGALVLWGGCYDGEWAPPFGPFAEAIATYARDAEPDTLRDDLGFGAAPIMRVVAAVRERLPDVPEPTPLQPDEERFRLLDAVSQFLIAVAARSPLVLVLDDLHWADKGTLAMLRHVARFAPQHRLLLLGTYRDVELDAQHPLTEALGAVYRETTCERIALKGLAASEVEQLVADSDVPTEIRDTVAGTLSAATSGNPFFVREVLHHLAEERQFAREPNDPSAIAKVGIPDSVRQVLNRRVRRLPAETGRLLTVGAVFAGPFHLGVAAQVAGLDEAAALNALDTALRAQLVRPADSAERYDFTHALIRETLCSELSPSRQVRLHRQIAQAMEQTYGELVGEHAAEVAQQYHRSKDLPGAEPGVTYAVAAADRAEAMYAYDEVVRLLRIAVELTPPTAPRPARLLGRLAFGLTWVLNFDEAVQVAHEAGELIATTEGVAAAADFLGEATANFVEAGSLKFAFKVAREGMAYIGEHRDLTWLRLVSCDVMRREQENAEYPGIPLDNPERREMSTLVRSLSPADLTGVMLLIPLASRHEMPRRWPMGKFMWTGDFQGSLASLEKWATRYEREGRINSAAICLAGLARCRLALGEIAAAEEAHAHAFALCDRLPVRGRAGVACAAYRFDRCIAVNEGWSELSTTVYFALQPDAEDLYGLAEARTGAAMVLARLGRAEAALQMLSAAPVALDRAPAWVPGYTAMACDAAATLWFAERTEYAECVERNLRDKVIAADFRYPMEDGRLALARLCALQRRYDEAGEWFARARMVLDEQGARPLRAIVDCDEALMYLRRSAAGDVERAAPLLKAALRQFHAVGMSGWIREAQTLFQNCGVRNAEAKKGPNPQPAFHNPQSRKPQSAMEGACVFRQEGEYWTLAYRGKTARLRNTKGLHYIARLLAQPGCEQHVRDLATVTQRSDTPNSSGPVRVESGLGTILDARATAQYKRRLAEARQELEEATAAGDLGEAARARHEVETITDQLSAAYGLGGRPRTAGDPAERMRKAVTNQIRRALERIRAAHPELGRHLTNALRTGFVCAYRPEQPVAWRL